MKRSFFVFLLFLLFNTLMGQQPKTGYLLFFDYFSFSSLYGFVDFKTMDTLSKDIKYPDFITMADEIGARSPFCLPEELVLYSCCELGSYQRAFELMFKGKLDTNATHKYDSLSNAFYKILGKYTTIVLKNKQITFNIQLVKIDALFCDCTGYQNKQVYMIKEITKISKVKRKERLAFKWFILSHLE